MKRGERGKEERGMGRSAARQARRRKEEYAGGWGLLHRAEARVCLAGRRPWEALYIGGYEANIFFIISTLQFIVGGEAKYVVENKGAV